MLSDQIPRRFSALETSFIYKEFVIGQVRTPDLDSFFLIFFIADKLNIFLVF